MVSGHGSERPGGWSTCGVRVPIATVPSVASVLLLPTRFPARSPDTHPPTHPAPTRSPHPALAGRQGRCFPLGTFAPPANSRRPALWPLWRSDSDGRWLLLGQVCVCSASPAAPRGCRGRVLVSSSAVPCAAEVWRVIEHLEETGVGVIQGRCGSQRFVKVTFTLVRISFHTCCSLWRCRVTFQSPSSFYLSFRSIFP